MIGTNIMVDTSKYFPTMGTFTLSASLLNETLAALRREGEYRVESLVFWAGTPKPDGTAVVTHVFVPKGAGVYLHALQVRVDENVIAALCGELDPPRLVLLGQVHTHMDEAFHSPSDDRFSLDTPGYISIVIPNFGRDDAEAWHTWAFYECEGGGRFHPLDSAECARRFIVVPDGAATVHDVRA